jgi:hypothetical protein
VSVLPNSCLSLTDGLQPLINPLRQKAGWDPEILAIELQGLIELDFDVALTGFSIPEVEMILDAAGPPANNTADDEIPDV